ncbi:MAG: hypothetical protein KBO60_18285 [Achromobacter sp.]|nr:hypothetical protein [Achromobacter sp.]
MNWIGWTTFGIAVVGATLGVFNAWWMVRRDAVRLRVRLVSLMTLPAGEWTLGIEVTNMGYVPITLTEVAIQKPGTSKRMAIASDYFRRVTLPHRMEPRTSITVAGDPGLRPEVLRVRARWCSATTACGVTVRSRFNIR